MKNFTIKMRNVALVMVLTVLTFSAVRGQQWTVYNTGNSGLPNNMVQSIATDGSGNKWIGTMEGLAKFDGTNWTVYNIDNSGLPDDYIHAIAIDSSGIIWIGTVSGLVKFDGVNWTVYDVNNSGLPCNDVYSIVIDGSGNKWIGTDSGGLSKFDGTNWTVYNNTNSGLPNNWVKAIALDLNGNKWIALFGGGLAKFDGINWMAYNSSNSGLQNDNIWSLAIDAYGNKWIGTYGGGLAMFDGTNCMVYNTGNSGLPDDNIYSIEIDNSGNKWIGTYGGLAKFDGINWTVYNTANSGLPNNNAYSTKIDNSGNKWIGAGGSGLAKFSDGGAVPLNNYCIIKGSIYNDLNANGIKDNGEPALPGKMVKVLNDSTYITTQNDGNFYIARDTGTYQIKYVPNQYWQLTSDSVLTVVVTPTSTFIDSVNFGIKMLTGIQDVSVDIVGNTARAGFQTGYWLTYKNNGTLTASGDVTLNIDSLTGFVSSNPAPDAQNGNTLSWNYSNLVSLEQRQIKLTLQMPDISHLGDALVFAATINPIPGDTAPADNVDHIEQVLTGSVDPNDKAVDKGKGASGYTLFGEELSYTIRFQNTGTDTAFTVQIRDTIDSNLDMATLRIVSTSHTMQFDVKGQNVVTFIFNNILLPDSNTNEPKSHGFVKFAIKPLPGLSENTVVTNDAFIYFDFNPAVPTNIVTNTFVSTIVGVGMPVASSNDIVIYPNPASSVISCELGTVGAQNLVPVKTSRWKLYNAFGSLIDEKPFAENKFSVDVSALAKGLYLLKVENEKGITVRRFIKE